MDVMATHSDRSMLPYEVMSRTKASSNALGSTTSNKPDAEPNALMIASAGIAWSARLHQPIVLRLPRGLAILISIMLLALLLLSYWVGHQRGTDAAEIARRTEQAAEQAVFHRTAADDSAVAVRKTNVAVGSGAGDLGNSETIMIEIHEPGSDPRQKGLNYFVLAHDTRPGAVALLAFLWRHGVDAAAFRKDNSGFYSVVALDYGFSRSELLGEVRQEYEQKLDRLGLEWEASQRGAKSFKKQGMFAQRHGGADYVAMITRKGQS